MSKQSKAILGLSIAMFVLGVVLTIITVGNLPVDIADGLKDNTGIRFLLGIILLLALFYVIYISVEAYRRHQSTEIEIEQNSVVKFDNLTQIYNFEYFIGLMQSMESPFSLVMLDIDNFKEINEKFDPVIGDLVLKVTAKSIKEHLRYTDILARYQGDVFLVLLSNCPPKNAKRLMEQIRISIMTNKDLSEKGIMLSTSVGITFVHEKGSIEGLIKNALEALCIAKSNEQDKKIVIYEEETEVKKKDKSPS